MRLFTAIDIPGSVTANLRVMLDRLKPHAKISWTTPEKTHITTKFIGDWPEDRLEEIKHSLTGLKGRIEISVRGLGWFPDPKRPRVLWAGVDGGAELHSLAAATDHALTALGVAANEHVYSPHLTLARIRKPVPLKGLKTAVDAGASTDFGSFSAAAFYLYLSRAGAYSKLAGFELV